MSWSCRFFISFYLMSASPACDGGCLANHPHVLLCAYRSKIKCAYTQDNTMAQTPTKTQVSI